MSGPVATPQGESFDATGADGPRLLISVRDASEAVASLLAGIDLLDVKEPRHGSLGRPSAGVVREIVASRDQLSPQTPLSLALGELAEIETAATPPPNLSGVQFVKLGLAGMAQLADWRIRWGRACDRLREASPDGPRFVAVAYADASAACAPSIEDVVRGALELGCSGLLIDTWGKSRGGLLSHVTPTDLATHADECHAAGLFFAVAGQLQTCDLAELDSVPIDIIAVRSAVCTGTDRRGRLSGALVREFSAAIRRANVWPHTSSVRLNGVGPTPAPAVHPDTAASPVRSPAARGRAPAG